jgi:hypothetical protein
MRKRSFVKLALALAGAFLFMGQAARAQTQTNVTGTVTDPLGIPYANGTLNIQIVPSGTNPTVNGAAIGGTLNGSLDANGRFSVSVWPNASIQINNVPGSSQWQFIVCTNSGGIPPPLGTGNQCTPPTLVTVAGASQSLSATLSAVAPGLTTITLGTGSVSSVSATAPIVATPNPIVGVGTISCPTCNVSGATIAGSIATGQVAFATGANTIGGVGPSVFGSPSFFWDSTNTFLTVVSNTADSTGRPGALSVQNNSTPSAGLSQFGIQGNVNTLAVPVTTGSFYGVFGNTSLQGGTVSGVIAGVAGQATTISGTIASSMTAVLALNGSQLTGGTVALNTGFRSAPQNTSATLNAAFYAEDQTSGATNFAYYSVGGKNFFGGTQGSQFGGPITAGTDNSVAGTLQLANSAANAHTIFASGATTTNTIRGFATAPVTGHIVTCTTVGTVCTLTDGGAPSSGAALSAITAAVGSNTIANGNNPQTWNWAQTTDAQDGMAFGETSAATGGTLTGFLANQALVSISTLTASTSTPLEIVQGSVTGTVAFPALQIESTWNNAGLTGQGIVFNVTNTSSAAGSLLINLGVGGTTQYSVDKVGNLVTLGNLSCGLAGTSSCVITGSGSTSGTATITWPAVAGTITNPILISNSLQLPSGTVLSWNGDTGFSRSSAGFLLLGNGTNGSTAGSLTLTTLGFTTRITNSNSGNLIISTTAPTISSGFGTGPSITANNGTTSFRINVGTGGVATTGVIGLPAANAGWNCYASDITTQTATVARTQQIGPGNTTTVTIGNFTDLGAAGAWVASDILIVSCFAL